MKLSIEMLASLKIYGVGLRHDDFIHNGRRFNGKTGEYLGWGDLSKQDLLMILSRMDDDDILVVTPEDSTRDMRVDEYQKVSTEWLVKNALYVLRYNKVFAVSEWFPTQKDMLEHKDSTTTLFAKVVGQEDKAKLLDPSLDARGLYDELRKACDRVASGM